MMCQPRYIGPVSEETWNVPYLEDTPVAGALKPFAAPVERAVVYQSWFMAGRQGELLRDNVLAKYMSGEMTDNDFLAEGQGVLDRGYPPAVGGQPHLEDLVGRMSPPLAAWCSPGRKAMGRSAHGINGSGDGQTESRADRYRQHVAAHAPALVFLCGYFCLRCCCYSYFDYHPAFSAFYYSFAVWDGYRPATWAGLDNYREIFTQARYIQSFGRMFHPRVPGQSSARSPLFPLFGAALVYRLRSERSAYLFRLLFVLPIVVPWVVTVKVWQQFYDPNNGLSTLSCRPCTCL